jgi:hypothetical protein
MKTYTKEEVLRFISEALDRAEEPEGKQQVSKEERFWQLMLQTNSIKIDKEKYPNSTFGFVDDECLWEYNSESACLWVRYDCVWSVLEEEFQLTYSDTKALIKNQVEEHFNCKGVTPVGEVVQSLPAVEKHFNCKGVRK